MSQLRVNAAVVALLLSAAHPGCTSSECSAGDGCASVLDGGDVVMIGTPGAGYSGYLTSPVASPLNAQASLPNQGYDPAMQVTLLAPTGALLYQLTSSTSNNTELRAMEGDRLQLIGGKTVFPLDPAANDPVIAASQCAEPVVTPTTWIMQEKTGALMYGCIAPDGLSDAPYDYYDLSGTLRVRKRAIFAWTAGGDKLVNATGGYELAVLNGTDIETAVSGLPNGVFSPSIEAKRVHGTGFWLVFYNADRSKHELWEITPRGIATQVGSYDATPGAPPWALDSAGVIYGIETDPSARDGYADGMVSGVPLSPGMKSVVIRDRSYPDTDLTRSIMHNTTFTAVLVTPP